MTTTLDESKRRLRAEAKRRRATAAAAAAAAAAAGATAGGAGEAVRDNFLAAVRLPAGAVVSGYWPLDGELDPRPLMTALHDAGHAIALPVVVASGRPLVFRAWSPGDRLAPAAFNTQVPGADRPERTPEVVLAPLLAFDRLGFRLGYGGGFYDRTLAGLRARGRALAVGLAYAGQEAPAVPHGPNDKRLDWVITEAEAIALDAARDTAGDSVGE